MQKSSESNKKRLVIFASGNGTNAENIIRYFRESDRAEVVAVFSNNRMAPVLRRAHRLKVKAVHFDRDALYDTNDVLNLLKELRPDLIVLAGFLWIFPEKILKRFPNQVINIHPALLPRHGGRGMYGSHVHRAVLAAGDKETGISVHYVDEQYDSGKLIFQARAPIAASDSTEQIEEKVHQLEQQHFPRVIEELLFKNVHEPS